MSTAPLASKPAAARALSPRHALVLFLAFAAAYFISTLIRAITATLSPVLTEELALSARDLGLLAGGYFLGFSLTQLPLGVWLDRHGPKKVILALLAVAVAACLLFALATGFEVLLLARVLCGVGVSACLMAPLTGYRRWFEADFMFRANAWMLMTGSFGMLMSTLPVQWLLPLWGWRPIFVALAVLLALVMVWIAWVTPRWDKPTQAKPEVEAQAQAQRQLQAQTQADDAGYRPILSHPYFWRMAPLALFCNGGMVAVQTLWAGPWMTQVAGLSAWQAATGLFYLNLAMLLAYLLWGMATPRLSQRGWNANRLIAWGMPLAFVALAGLIASGARAGAAAPLALTAYCLCSTFIALAQPAVGTAYPARLAGRALSAYNLLIFIGAFTVQWGVGLCIDAFKGAGWSQEAAYQGAFSVLACMALLAYLWFVFSRAEASDWKEPAPKAQAAPPGGA